MGRVPSRSQRRYPLWVRIALSFAALAGYAAVFMGLFPIGGAGLATLNVLPAAAAGWLLGRWGGLVFAVLVSATTGVLLPMTGLEGDPADAIRWGLPSTVVLLAVAGIVGRLRELLWEVRETSDALADASAEVTEQLEARERLEEERARVEGELERVEVQLTSAAQQIFATAQQQEGGAVAQSSAVGETLATMQSLLESSRQINATSTKVAANAERTLVQHDLMGESIHGLADRLERIGDVAGSISDIANKSEMLALNASLEGVRAGEAGRGFALVASQMQRLAETILASARDIKETTTDIERASTASVEATEEGKALAAEAASSAQDINLIAQQQQSGAEQVASAIEEIATVAQQTARGSAQIVSATEELKQLSSDLHAVVAALQERTAKAVSSGER